MFAFAIINRPKHTQTACPVRKQPEQARTTEQAGIGILWLLL